MKPIDILLVEDSEGDIVLTKKALARGKLNNNLHIARDGEEAINFLKSGESNHPDLVLLDLNLPRVNGQEVLKFIKETESLKRIPVIILTTSEADQDIIESYNLHANGYIVKPVNIGKFFEVVAQIQNFWFTIVKLPSSH